MVTSSVSYQGIPLKLTSTCMSMYLRCFHHSASSNASGSRLPTSPPAPGSPMRAPRREPPPPPLSQESLTRMSSLDRGLQRRGSQDSSPYIQIQRTESPKSGMYLPALYPSLHLYVPAFSTDSPPNGVLSPPHTGSGGHEVGRSRLTSSSLPPLPPSALLAPGGDQRRYCEIAPPSTCLRQTLPHIL